MCADKPLMTCGEKWLTVLMVGVLGLAPWVALALMWWLLR